jgi:hypothetical protein
LCGIQLGGISANPTLAHSGVIKQNPGNTAHRTYKNAAFEASVGQQEANALDRKWLPFDQPNPVHGLRMRIS